MKGTKYEMIQFNSYKKTLKVRDQEFKNSYINNGIKKYKRKNYIIDNLIK